jgi:predicted nucleotidyltransferase component of viral defense system
MTAPKNIPASVKARLLNVARERHEDFNFILNRYFQERLLYRLSKSKHASDFVLKGAALFTLWTGHPHRPTKDTDFLGFGEPSPERLATLFVEIVSVPCPEDGLEFDASAVKAAPIREQALYDGIRVVIPVRLGNAKSNIQVDVGFGDALTPAPVEVSFPTLIDLPAPVIRTYQRETVVAEKLEALVSLGYINSRMKDFYDLDTLFREHDMDGSTLTDAIRATFERRGTAIPTELPTGLTDEFGADEMKQTQWRAFTRKNGLDASMSLLEVVQRIRAAVRPHLRRSP